MIGHNYYYYAHNYYYNDNRIDKQFLIKVGDFGLSEEICTTNYFRQGEETSVKLPIKWMALESIIDGIFSEKTDVVSKIQDDDLLQASYLISMQLASMQYYIVHVLRYCISYCPH